ncbi:hypothetical protein AC578_2343 [Pseudocercospora eumusae]|uniref:Uncharacterized protein n=1 Tax=Pseudocercospora eumusae TaxID=321146 RepID=A0A139HXN9_9PEZI|nr:hypothetical protein AC578_2343 [Pseudocercospora eumusae]
MALPSTAPQPFAAAERQANSKDPFYHSTPRTNSESLSSLMSALPRAQVLPAPTRVTPSPSFRMSRYARRPQCTHMMMNRVHGHDLICAMCGRPSDLGWLYQCEQDDRIPQNDPLPDIDATPFIPDTSDYFDAKARVAELLRMSPSVVKAIRNGHYDVDQIDTLIAQKEKLISVIAEKESHFAHAPATSPRNSFNPQNIISSVGASYQAPYQNCRVSASLPPSATPRPPMPSEAKVAIPTKQDSVLGKRSQDKCCFQVCHSCRPYFGDRAYETFETVLANETNFLNDLKGLPIMSASLARNLGLRRPPPHILRSFQSQQSMDITVHDSTDDASTQISLDWTPANTNIEDETPLDSAELFPCPGPLQCPVWRRKSGCAYDAGFDDGKRAENHGYLSRITPENSMSLLTGSIHGTPGEASSTASSISLPTPTRSSLAPLKANSVCGELNGENQKIGLRSKHSSSSFGSEIEVEGGVALTEEAVEARIPDIVTDEYNPTSA